jgi:hypothetical protein
MHELSIEAWDGSCGQPLTQMTQMSAGIFLLIQMVP